MFYLVFVTKIQKKTEADGGKLRNLMFSSDKSQVIRAIIKICEGQSCHD